MKKKTRIKVDPVSGEAQTTVYWDHYVELPPGADGKRNRRHVQAPTRRQVQEKADQIRKEFERDGHIANPKMTVSELLELWKRAVLPAKESSSTVASIKLSCRHLNRALGQVRLIDLSPRHIDAMFENSNLAKASKKKILTHLSQALHWARKRNHVRDNVAELADPPHGKVAETRALNNVETAKFLAAAEGEPQELFCYILVSLGLRFGEALGLTWNDVDLEKGIVRVRRQARRDALTHKVELTETLKTKSSLRAIGISSAAIDLFKQHLQAQAGQVNPLKLVFVSESGGLLDHSNMRRAIQRIATSAGVGRVTPNVLRRTACSQLVDAGESLVRVADLLGHSDTRTTEKFYRKRLQEVQMCAADRSADLIEVMKNSSVEDGKQIGHANQMHAEDDLGGADDAGLIDPAC